MQKRAGGVDVVFILGARRTGTTLLNQIRYNDPRANPQARHLVCVRTPRDRIVSEVDMGKRQKVTVALQCGTL